MPSRNVTCYGKNIFHSILLSLPVSANNECARDVLHIGICEWEARNVKTENCFHAGNVNDPNPLFIIQYLIELKRSKADMMANTFERAL